MSNQYLGIRKVNKEQKMIVVKVDPLGKIIMMKEVSY